MVSRRSRNVFEHRWLVTCAAAWLGLSGCGGAEFTGEAATAGKSSAQAGSRTAGDNAGGKASGGAGAEANGGDTSSAGASDVGGSGGSGSSSCSCQAHQYCRDGTQACLDCAELNRLHFSTPERMPTVSDSGAGSHFPRVGRTDTDLVYAADGAGLRYSPVAPTSAGGSVKGSVDTDSGPLLLGSSVAGPGTMLMTFDFLFDRSEGTQRSLYVGQWSDGELALERAPGPYNGTNNDYSMAVATKPSTDGIARVFWMTDRGVAAGAPATLVTALLVANAPAAPVNLKVGQEACAATDAELAPWVTPDGKTLLVSHTRVDAGCQATGQKKDIYTALLQPATGLPTAAALPLDDVNSPLNDVEPSFSTDMCELYFASDRDGKYAVYRARRR